MAGRLVLSINSLHVCTQALMNIYYVRFKPNAEIKYAIFNVMTKINKILITKRVEKVNFFHGQFHCL